MVKCKHCGGSLTKKGFRKEGQNYKCKQCGKQQTKPLFVSDKKVGETDWREWSQHLQAGQKLHEKSSCSQDKCQIEIKTDKDHIIYQPLSDIHIGSIGCDYKSLEDFTDMILNFDNVFFSLTGDSVDGFYQFKNMLAIHQMQLSPEEQLSFFESWVNETRHKFLFSTWGNHEAMEERASGMNSTKRMLNRKIVYFNGIGIANLKINDVEYKIVATHKTRNNSMYNRTHGLKQLARNDIPDADIYLAGHIHTSSFEMAFERGQEQLFALLGTLKKNDGFAKRYFSYYVSQQMTAIVLNTKKKEFIPFSNLKQALKYCGEV
jgi:hypothetical protein